MSLTGAYEALGSRFTVLAQDQPGALHAHGAVMFHTQLGVGGRTCTVQARVVWWPSAVLLGNRQHQFTGAGERRRYPLIPSLFRSGQRHGV